jgi:hypothetical protein
MGWSWRLSPSIKASQTASKAQNLLSAGLDSGGIGRTTADAAPIIRSQRIAVLVTREGHEHIY